MCCISNISFEAITTTAIILQLLILLFVYIGNHKRKRKQSTIEFLTTIREKYWPQREFLFDKFKNNVINIKEIEGEGNEEVKRNVVELLSVVEHLSVGLNSGIYDFNIFIRMSGNYFLFLYKTLTPYYRTCTKKTNGYI